MRKHKSKIELLAPAGSFQGFIGAINAGADAVYLAGNKYGARAFADNFTQEELEEVLFLAKLFEIKVYLTVNTLLKNTEMNELYSFIKPLYDLGLNGVIVQDFGVFTYIKEHFPGLELHASTQMTVTSSQGARYLMEQGMKRIVLARELTLKEIQEINSMGIETECFIHGSMCYCYSGQCLLSSMIGGRSGNRGRCAQPCRLPYKTSRNEEAYYLSLKDMCTLEHIPQLIDSGIASFKIEGRMKNPAYAARVTQIYRKYIDQYLKNPGMPYQVTKEDLEQLKNLYIRTSLHNGYYYKNHGADMITKESPAYSKTDSELVDSVMKDMILTKPSKRIRIQGTFEVGQPAALYVETTVGDRIYSAYVTGDDVQEALKSPLDRKTVEEHLAKTGDSYFTVESMDVYIGGNIFMPIKAVNELRRRGLAVLKASVTEDMKNGREAKECREIVSADKKSESNESKYIAFVEDEGQFEAVLSADYISRVVLPYDWVLSMDCKELQHKCDMTSKEIYWSMPAICRTPNWDRINLALKEIKENSLGKGFYVNQYDSLSYIREYYSGFDCIGDLNLYAMNNETIKSYGERMNGFTIPVELNKDELRHMDLYDGELILYGRIPLMQTANCIFLSTDKCGKNKKTVEILRDRIGTCFPFKGHCDEKICYNTIYNSVPVSLHKHKTIIDSLGISNFQLRFTVETKEETIHILKLYGDFNNNIKIDDAKIAYTNGHFLRGVQ